MKSKKLTDNELRMLKMNTRVEFNNKIKELMRTTNMGIMDSILFYCEENKLEYETVSDLISQENKQRLREEAETINLLPKTAKLPI